MKNENYFISTILQKVGSTGYSLSDQYPSSIYSCSIDYFLEHEICHLGCLGRNKKFLKRPNFCLSMQLFRVVFSTFWLSIEQLYIELGYFSVRIQKLHNIAGLSEAGGPGGLSYKLKIGYHSRFFGRKS